MTHNLPMPLAHKAVNPVQHSVSVSVNDAIPELSDDKKLGNLPQEYLKPKGSGIIFDQYSSNKIENMAGMNFGKNGF